MATAAKQDESLKRLGGGRWQTRDERFTIEPQSGTWVVVDAEQTDELGLALVRGPFGSLGAAKEAIETARGADPAASPLADRVANLKRSEAPSTAKTKSAKSASPTKPAAPSEPAEPRWIQGLDASDRRRAKRLIDRLDAAGAPDAEGMARRDIVGDVAAVAGFAVKRALESLGDEATPSRVARLLADGRDDELEVRWRLVDGDDRPITIDSKG